MPNDETPAELSNRVWEHIRAKEFAQAETALRQLIDTIDPNDSIQLCHLDGLLAGVLNSQSRQSEGTDIYRRALAKARRSGNPSATEVNRYFLANQFLLFGDPSDALSEAQPVPAGAGHVQCLLHSVCAEALWKMGRRDEARAAAQRAMDAAPTAERLADMTRHLAHMLNAG